MVVVGMVDAVWWWVWVVGNHWGCCGVGGGVGECADGDLLRGEVAIDTWLLWLWLWLCWNLAWLLNIVEVVMVLVIVFVVVLVVLVLAWCWW